MKTRLIAIMLTVATLSASGQDWLKGNEPAWAKKSSADLAADPAPSPIAAGNALRLEKVYVDYIANLEALRAKEIAEHAARSGPMGAAFFESPRKVQLDAKIAATKYCLSALRKEFGLPNTE